jgi:UDP:flavonoid glycosyltransferase YjiC (YdhE family)
MITIKILFANVPGAGHFNPLTGLAVHLKNAGHDVRWYTQNIFEEKIKRLGIPYYPFRKTIQTITPIWMRFFRNGSNTKVSSKR